MDEIVGQNVSIMDPNEQSYENAWHEYMTKIYFDNGNGIFWEERCSIDSSEGSERRDYWFTYDLDNAIEGNNCPWT